MIGRPKVPLVLTTPEQQALDSLAHRARTAPQVARRARIVLACARGLDNQTVAKKLRVSPQMVGRWRARFVTRRVDGLLDAPRPGAPRTITDDTVEAVIVRTLETTPDGATHWSTRTLAKATGLSHGTIARIWRAFGLQPHRTKTFTLSPDPLLVEKVRDVVGLYLHPPDHALVLCVDEKSQIQALDRTQPLLPMQPGQTARHTHTYRRHGTTSLFAALDTQSGGRGRCSGWPAPAWSAICAITPSRITRNDVESTCAAPNASCSPGSTARASGRHTRGPPSFTPCSMWAGPRRVSAST